MNKEKIEKEYKKKIKLINNYNKNYYELPDQILNFIKISFTY